MFNDTLNTHAPWLMASYFEVPIWAWLAIPLLAVASYAFVKLVLSLIIRLVFMAKNRLTETDTSGAVFTRLSSPLSLLGASVLFVALRGLLPFSEEVRAALLSGETVVNIFAVTWMLFIGIELAFNRTSRLLDRYQRRSAKAMIPLLRKVAKTLIAVFAFLFLLQTFGFNVGTVIAGLGIGGVAIALASQKSIENLFGGVTLVLDQPVRVGDFCIYDGNKLGTVEDVGLRSTRVRALDRSLVTIPNSEFSQMQLQNLTERDQILFWKTIGVRYETTPDQMYYIVSEIRKMLVSHEKIDNDPARARFIALNDYSLDIEIFAYTKTDDWDAYLAIQEDLLLRIMRIVDAAGSGFAFPSQTMYYERGESLDKDKQAKISEHMQQIKEKGELPIPDFAPEVVRDMTNSIPFPGKASAVRQR